ncbi:cytochrome P450 [Mycobacterium sp. NPDC050853]|uniref:cytochrome P450 n=1 Tax=Mycobacterium sp. NPDC050853 TaxID=3155160 RepID=UPI0033D13345
MRLSRSRTDKPSANAADGGSSGSSLAPLAPGTPLLGSILAFRRDILEATRIGWERHGGVVRYRLGPLQVYCVSDYQLAAEALANTAVYGKLGNTSPLRLVLGQGLLTTADHDHWKRNRRMMQPLYSRPSIAGMYSTMVECAEAMLADLAEVSRSGAVVDIHPVIIRATLDIVSRCMFGMKAADAEIVVTPESVEEILTYAFNRQQNPFSPPLVVPTPANRRFRALMGSFDDFVYGLIRSRRECPGTGGDLLDMLLSAQDAETGEGLSDTEIRDEVITTFAAGHETMAQTLTWALYLLSQNDSAREVLEAEVDSVLGGRLPTLDDLAHLPYAQQVVSEALRLYPSAPILPRLVSEDTVLGGYRIPKGARLLISVFNIGRDPEQWRDPGQFDPARFIGDKPAGVHHRAYAPFGGGPHVCIGKHFALMEGQLVLAALIQNYRFEHDPGHRVEMLSKITLRPKHGMRLAISPRRSLKGVIRVG